MTSNVTNENTTVEQLIDWDKKHFFHPTSSLRAQQENGPANIFVEGEGIYVKDAHNNRFIDGLSMLWNVNLGHGRTELAEAAKEQMSKLSFTSNFQTNSNEPAIRLSNKIASLAPGDLNVVFYTSGGSESNETAFKLIRYYWKLKGQEQRTKVIGLERSYHGVTMGATSATGIKNFQDFSPAKAPNFFHAKPFLTNCELGDKTDPEYEGCIRDIIEKEGPETIAAVILEPIQGAGGVHVPPEGYLKAVRKLCDEYGIFMITDEVICGFGRTGKMFGVDNWEVVPDIMTVAKGITSGYIQLGAVVMKEKIRDELADLSDDVFFHGFTYSGHPTACAVALKTLEIIEKENIVSNVKQMEAEFLKGFAILQEKYKFVTKTRVLGLLGAFELYEDRDQNKPFDPSVHAAPKFVQECYKRGLIVRPVAFGDSNIICFAPPLITNKQEVNEMINIFSDVLAEFEKM